MPDGDVKSDKGINRFRSTLTFLAIDAKGAVGDGVWIDTGGFPLKTVEVQGITTATVVVTESHTDSANKPANTTHGSVQATLTADGLTSWESAARWVKVRISAHTLGTITAYLGIST